jgi:hypothetical protein
MPSGEKNMAEQSLKEKRDALISFWQVKFQEVLTQDIGARRRAATITAISLLARISEIYDDSHLNIINEYLHDIENRLTINEVWVSNLSEPFILIRELREFLDASPIVTDLTLVKLYPNEMKRPHVFRVHLDEWPPTTF